MVTMRDLLEALESDVSPYGRSCSYCGAPIVSTCRCPDRVRPHTVEQLLNGHGDMCENGHRSEPTTGLVIDARSGEQLAS